MPAAELGPASKEDISPMSTPGVAVLFEEVSDVDSSRSRPEELKPISLALLFKDRS